MIDDYFLDDDLVPHDDDLDQLMEELDITYNNYQEQKRLTKLDLYESYICLYDKANSIYRLIWSGLSPAYLSGSEFYLGPDFPVTVFNHILGFLCFYFVMRNEDYE